MTDTVGYFINTYTSSVTAAFKAAILAAEQTIVDLWSAPASFYINLKFDLQAQGMNGVLASNSWPFFVSVTYDQLVSALKAHDTSSSYGLAAIATLPATDPNPAGGADWSLPEAYARMLGLSSATPAIDNTITLNSSYGWTYGQDVINTLIHEITEGAMGRVGGLGDQNGVWSTMDLFRYSAPGTRDYTDGRDRQTTYFSYNGTDLSTLSFNNSYNGTKRINSGDVADFAQLDVFGTGSPGETDTLSQTDIEIMDVLGWAPSSSPPPPPGPPPPPPPPPALADLVVASISAPTSVAQGTPLSFSYVVQDRGSAAAGFHYAGIEIDQVPDETHYIAWNSISSLAANGGQLTLSNSISTAGLSIGTHTLYIKEDYWFNAIGESDESNNIRSVTFTVTSPPPPPLPDLVVASISAPASVAQGAPLSFSYVVQDLGGASAGFHYAGIEVDQVPDETHYIAWNSVNSLAANGGQLTLSNSISTAGLSVGTHTLYIKEDYWFNGVSESNESNNIRSTSFNVV